MRAAAVHGERHRLTPRPGPRYVEKDEKLAAMRARIAALGDPDVRRGGGSRGGADGGASVGLIAAAKREARPTAPCFVELIAPVQVRYAVLAANVTITMFDDDIACDGLLQLDAVLADSREPYLVVTLGKPALHAAKDKAVKVCRGVVSVALCLLAGLFYASSRDWLVRAADGVSAARGSFARARVRREARRRLRARTVRRNGCPIPTRRRCVTRRHQTRDALLAERKRVVRDAEAMVRLIAEQ